MGTYLKSLNVIRYTNDKRKITVTCIYELYSNMTINKTMPASPVDGNIILDFSIVEDKTKERGNIIRLKEDYTFTLLADWDSSGGHLSLVQLANPTTARDEESMETKDATPVT